MTAALLVAAQFALIAAIVACGAASPFPPLAMAAIGAGAALGLWTLAHNRPGNFNIRPLPKPQARLVTGGPYRWVRHPMYDALLLVMAGLAGTAVAAWLAWAALAGVLAAKAAIEERHLRHAHSGYAAYAAITRRFIPGIY